MKFPRTLTATVPSKREPVNGATRVENIVDNTSNVRPHRVAPTNKKKFKLNP